MESRGFLYILLTAIYIYISLFLISMCFQYVQVPRGAAASICFKTGLAHLEQNQLSDALSCFDEAFLALAKDQSRGSDIKAQATICAQYKIAVTLLQVIILLSSVGKLPPKTISIKWRRTQY